MSIAAYILVMAGVTYLTRMLPFTFFRRQIKSRFIKSILYYLPYGVLTAMTFPAIFYSTGKPIAASIGTAVALLLAYFDLPMVVVSLSASLAALAAGIMY